MVIGLALHAIQNGAAYLCPAYLTYKAIKKGHQIKKWCIYWCVLGVLTSVEFMCDLVLFWLPFYRLFKILFVLYLWNPNTNGAQMLYARCLAPYLRENEARIDVAAEEVQEWLQKRFVVWREQALIALGRGAVVVLEKAQELGSPKRSADSPRIGAFTDDCGINNAINTEPAEED